MGDKDKNSNEEVTVRVDSPNREEQPLTPEEKEERDTQQKLAQLEGMEPSFDEAVAKQPVADPAPRATSPPAPIEATPDQDRADAIMAQARQKARIEEQQKRGGRAPKIFAWIFAILFIVAAAAAVYLYMQYTAQKQTAAGAQNELNIQQPKIAKLEKDLADTKKAASASTATPTPAPAQAAVYREIPEWGVRYKVTDENKDLTYLYSGVSGSSESDTVLQFSDTTHAKIMPGDASTGAFCNAEKSIDGSIRRFKVAELGSVNAKQAAKITPDMVTKKGDYYYYFQRAQTLCDDKTKDLQVRKNDAVKSLLTTLESV